ncbi:MAG: beta-N-acetylhexosaminidase [Gammaproteobacteria bacterium]
MSLGPLMVDLRSTALDAEERELLAHPLVGGVILFSRNYAEPAQIADLIARIHALRAPRLLVAVDHEGGTVQRFRAGFSPLPAISAIGALYDRDRRRALALAEDCGWILAAELRAVGVDFSFAPVLDLRAGVSTVVNDRAFHADPDTVVRLARAHLRGIGVAGSVGVGKHFPGHGSVRADSHHELPVDPRPIEDIRLLDLVPFMRLAPRDLAGIMPAHVVYPALDDRPAGFSRRWLREILRTEIGFAGTIFSDDICMAGAVVAGSPPERARAALDAGCDMVLVCNDRAAAIAVIDGLGEVIEPASQVRLMRMHGRRAPGLGELQADARWQRVHATLAAFDTAPELDLRDDTVA